MPLPETTPPAPTWEPTDAFLDALAALLVRLVAAGERPSGNAAGPVATRAPAADRS
jgi:hypothetical protein